MVDKLGSSWVICEDGMLFFSVQDVYLVRLNGVLVFNEKIIQVLKLGGKRRKVVFQYYFY